MTFEPFDEGYKVDESVLTEEIPDFLDQSLRLWIQSVFSSHGITRTDQKLGLVLDQRMFLYPLQETFRRKFPPGLVLFMHQLFLDIKLLRNVISYILQTLATFDEGRELERIFQRSGSAYTVEFIKGEEARGILTAKGEPIFSTVGMRLAYRVPTIVEIQAKKILNTQVLLSEAWSSHYGINPDDEKTVTRCTDALAGLLRDKYFPDDKKPQLGKFLKQMIEQPEKYPLPAEKLYDKKKFLELMQEFSAIRGNHKTGTGRAPTYEEAGFVLHYAIMLFQILESKK